MSDRILVATRKGLFTVERGGNRDGWTITGADFLGDNVSMTLVDPRDGTRYAALDHGHFGVKLHRAQPGSSTWEECAAPTYPEKPQDEVDSDAWGKPIPWSTVRIWCLEPGGPDERGVLWCGTIPGGLFRSADSGSSWELVRPLWDDPRRKAWFGGGADLPGIHSICVDPRDAACLRVAVSCGGIWESRDGGASWDCPGQGMWAAYMPPERQHEMNVQDPHRLVQCAARPDWLWVQHHNGVFVSQDGGRNWREASNAAPSNFGFAVAVHPEAPQTAWFVPAVKDERRIPVGGQLVVARTRDGGESFEVLRDGLPQEHAYDIAYRHALDVSETGRDLAFGTTTGGFWVSEDEGDSWACIANHLPPVYAVRFVRS